MAIALSHPEIAGRSCEDCKKWLYEDYGEKLSYKKLTRGRDKTPQPRPANAPTPCRLCPKIPAGASPIPENAIEVSNKSWRCLAWYYQARAAGMTKAEREDLLCRRNMGIIDPIVRQHEIEVGTMKAVATMFARSRV